MLWNHRPPTILGISMRRPKMFLASKHTARLIRSRCWGFLNLCLNVLTSNNSPKPWMIMLHARITANVESNWYLFITICIYVGISYICISEWYGMMQCYPLYIGSENRLFIIMIDIYHIHFFSYKKLNNHRALKVS